ncbi:MAG TPA: hypothetical protein VG476_02645 [Acidimicrobiales bacterium]|nr:hypothetical protein [Acidimicrobiales bacterium]
MDRRHHRRLAVPDGDAVVHIPDVRRGEEAATLAAKSVPGDLSLPAVLIVLRILA